MSRLRAIALLLIILTLTACGAPEPTPGASTSGTSVGEAESTSEPAMMQTPTTVQADATVDAGVTPTGTLATAASGATVEPEMTAAATTPRTEAAFPFVYTDANQRKVTLKQRPRRIVALFPVNNETLFAIGAGEQVIAVDDFTAFPKAAASKPKIGGANFKFNTEKIVGLDPDLVITSFGTEEILDKALRDAGVPVLATPYPTSLSATYALIRDLGKISGHVDEANQLSTKLRGELEAVQRQTAKSPKVPVYYETDASTPGKPFTVNKGTLGDELLAAAGGRNVFSGVKSAQVSFESIVSAKPKVILLGNVKGYVPENFFSPTTVQEVKQRKGFSTIPAVRDNRVVPIYVERLVPGPRLGQGLRDLAVAIHPEIFGER